MHGELQRHLKRTQRRQETVRVRAMASARTVLQQMESLLGLLESGQTAAGMNSSVHERLFIELGQHDELDRQAIQLQGLLEGRVPPSAEQAQTSDRPDDD